MSKAKRGAKRNARARWWKASGIRPPESDVARTMREGHQASRPWCTYGRDPHFIPPSFGDEGFFLCDADKPGES